MTVFTGFLVWFTAIYSSTTKDQLAAMIVFTKESLAMATRQELALYVWGFIDYLDVFKIRHCTNFCFVNRADGTGFKVCSNNNKMTDAECKYKYK